MRLTSVTLAFIFFGTVFATPIYSLRGNAVELSKRATEGQPMPGLGGDGEDPPQSPGRGRGMSRGRGGGSRKGKAKAVADLAGDSDVDTSVSPSGGTKRRKGQTSRSASKRRKADSNLVTEAVFVEALRHIKTDNPGQGSRSLGVYQITEKVNGHDAVVKIIDERLEEKDIKIEVARSRQVGQLLGWGKRAGNPRLDYILMMNMGVPLGKVEGLDASNPEDKTLIDGKKTAALQHHETENHLKHDDPEGEGNYLWQVNHDATEKADRYNVNVVDWAGATKVGGQGVRLAAAPKPWDVPSDIYAPKESQKSSKKATSSPSNSGGDKTPPHTGPTGGRTGTRSQTRKDAAGTSGTTS